MAEARVKGVLSITGLGSGHEMTFNAPTSVTPSKTHYNFRTQATADTPEALDTGGVTTIKLLVLKAVSGAVDVDLDFSSAFDSDITIPEGETAILPIPSGTVYISNNVSNNTVTYEYWAVGV
jgi:hypothetical protein